MKAIQLDLFENSNYGTACSNCGNQFVSDFKTKKYCQSKCRKSAQKKRKRKRLKQERLWRKSGKNIAGNDCKYFWLNGLSAYKAGCRCTKCKREKAVRNYQGNWKTTRKEAEKEICKRENEEKDARKKQFLKLGNDWLQANNQKCDCLKRLRFFIERKKTKLKNDNIALAKAMNCKRPDLNGVQKGCNCFRCRGWKNATTRRRERLRRETDVQFRIAAACRARLRGFLRGRGFKKPAKTFEMIGCSPKALMNHLLSCESNEDARFTAQNYGKEWVIDHVVPLASANGDPQEIQRLCHFSNLQPLSPEDNLAKGDKF